MEIRLSVEACATTGMKTSRDTKPIAIDFMLHTVALVVTR